MYQAPRKKILVTGGAGFLGSHLCERLVAEGHRVYCIDDLSTGSIDNINELLWSGSFTFLKQDVRALPELDVDEIYNLACPASPQHYQRDEAETIMTCLLGADAVLRLAARTGAKVLQASTSEVYGDPNVHPQTEEYCGSVNTLGPRACYDEGKRAAESLFFIYHRRQGTRIKVARIFNTYGPRMLLNDGRIVSNFVAQALAQLPLTIYGQGTQTRSFCYVSDLIEGLVQLMATGDHVTGPINLGNPDERSVLELAEIIVREVGSSSAFDFQPLPIHDPRRRCPDITRAMEQLDWMPQVALEDGLRRTIADFEMRMDRAGQPLASLRFPPLGSEHQLERPRIRRRQPIR